MAYAFFEQQPRQAARAAMQCVKQHDGLVSLAPSSCDYLQRIWVDQFLALAEGVDVLLPNLDEGRVLTGETQPEQVTLALLQWFPVVALKKGADGALAGSGSTVVHQPGFAAPVVDTTGAGDACAAAFIVSWLARRDLKAALVQGTRLAADVVQAAAGR